MNYKYYKNLLYSNPSYKATYEVIKKLLNEEDSEKKYLLLGKAYLSLNDLKDALKYFKKVIELNPNQAASYYQMFKINIRENNYYEAKDNLLKYQFLHNTEVGNYLKLIDSCINIIENKKELPVLSKKKINDAIDLYYNEAIDYINNQEIDKAILNLQKCQKIVVDKNLNIEFLTTIQLLNNINSLLQSNKKLYKAKLLDNIKNNVDIIESTRQLLLVDPSDIKNYLKSCNKIIDIDKNIALNLINKINNPIYNEEKNYLLLKINENSKSDLTNLFIEQAKNNDSVEQYSYYKAGLILTNDNIFNYYLGKFFYKEKNYKIAKEYLLKSNSIEKYNKTILFLALIYYKEKNYKKVQKIIKSNEKMSIFEDYEYRNFCFYNTSTKDDKVLSKIHMTIDDFKRPND